MLRNLLPSSTLKRIILILIFAEIFTFTASANPGDTTWVTVFNLRKLTYYGNYDTTAIFPTGKRYRKIRMHYILGRYACPAGSQYCGSWDYTTQIFARPANNDSVEIARVITPYATDWLAQNKKHDYVVEVTDYASVLEGTTGMRFRYDGYSWGFTITLKIEFIEGVPPMDATKVKNVYDGYFPYGNNANPIENYLTSKTFSYTSQTNKIFLKNSISGHGSDNTGCAEFCNKYYQLNINNSFVAQRQLWRADCGENQVYPQTGTWIYDRGNWCPGAVVWPIYHDITNVTTANTNFSVNIDMQPYIGSGSLGGYSYETQLIHYSAPNHVRDVSVEDIMAPNKDPNYVRQNPRCANPIIKIKNTGTTPVTSISINYNTKGGAVMSHTWTGSLNFLDTTLVVLPAASSILSGSVTGVFEVSVTAVNNTAGDDNLFNNIYSVQFDPVAVFPKSFVVKIQTNNAAAENQWVLYDEYDFPIVTSAPFTNATTIRDTILELQPGCYRISLTDYGCNGLSWWANTAAGNGSMRIDRIGVNSSAYVFPVDFGCSFTKFFTVLPDPPPPNPVSVSSINNTNNLIEVFPNPASTMAYIQLDLSREQTVTYKIMGINGSLISEKTMNNVSSLYETIDITNLDNGVYFVTVKLQDNSSITKKLVIQK